MRQWRAAARRIHRHSSRRAFAARSGRLRDCAATNHIDGAPQATVQRNMAKSFA